MKDQVKGFLDFIREKSVVGLAVGFILGGAVSGLVKSIVEDIINPILSLALKHAKTLTDLVIPVGDGSVKLGNFINVLINFIVVAAVVYFGVKWLRLDKLDKSKS